MMRVMASCCGRAEERNKMSLGGDVFFASSDRQAHRRQSHDSFPRSVEPHFLAPTSGRFIRKGSSDRRDLQVSRLETKIHLQCSSRPQSC